jgi:hypothetical protein
MLSRNDVTPSGSLQLNLTRLSVCGSGSVASMARWTELARGWPGLAGVGRGWCGMFPVSGSSPDGNKVGRP